MEDGQFSITSKLIQAVLPLDLEVIRITDRRITRFEPRLYWKTHPLLYIFIRTRTPSEMKIGVTSQPTPDRILLQKFFYAHHDYVILVKTRNVPISEDICRKIEGQLQYRVKTEMPWCHLQEHTIRNGKLDPPTSDTHQIVSSIFEYLKSLFSDEEKSVVEHFSDGISSIKSHIFCDIDYNIIASGGYYDGKFWLARGSKLIPYARSRKNMSSFCTLESMCHVGSLYVNGYIKPNYKSSVSCGFISHRPISFRSAHQALWCISGGYDLKIRCIMGGDEIWKNPKLGFSLPRDRGTWRLQIPPGDELLKKDLYDRHGIGHRLKFRPCAERGELSRDLEGPHGHRQRSHGEDS